MSVSSVRQIARDLLTLQSKGILGSLSMRSSFTSSHFTFDPNNSFLSDADNSMSKSTPIPFEETNRTIGNKYNAVDWKNSIPLAEYSLNEDNKPKIIKKKTSSNLEYIQDIAIRNLRPPTPPLPGDIVITMEPNSLTPPAPPIIIRQQPPRPSTPEPLILREAPPKPPAPVGRKVITITGKKLPPPPRKVVVERLAPLPSKPQAIIAERWLPYSEVKRRVLFRPAPPDPIIVKPRNIVVQWTPPSVTVRQAVRYLGVVKANPADYIKKYSTNLKLPNEFPQVILDIKTPNGLVLAADSPDNDVHELEGEVYALNLVDMEREGLADYIPQVRGLSGHRSTSIKRSSSDNLSESAKTLEAIKLSIIDQIFGELDKNKKGYLTVKEAERILLKLNTRLGRSFGEDELKLLFQDTDIDTDHEAKISLEKFRVIFKRVL